MDHFGFLQSMFMGGALIMAGMGAWSLAERIKGGFPLVGGAIALFAIYWFDILDKFR